jgi:hypothetical protein
MVSAIAISSSHVASSAAVKATAGRVYGVIAYPTATAGSVIIKNGGTGGTAVLQIDTPASATAAVPSVVLIPHWIDCSTDIWCTLSNAKATVLYK